MDKLQVGPQGKVLWDIKINIGLIGSLSQWSTQTNEYAIHIIILGPPEAPYLLDEFLLDINDSHRVEHTVFVECASMYRATEDEAFKPVGETENTNGIAAMSASGLYGELRIASAIVSFADLMAPQIERVLASHARASER